MPSWVTALLWVLASSGLPPVDDSCRRSAGHVGRPAELSVLGSTGPLCTGLPPQFVAMSAAQNKLCSLFGDHVPAVRRGAVLAVDECQRQFRHRRWNCSIPPAATTVATTNAAAAETTGEDDLRSTAAVAELLAPSITIGDHSTLGAPPHRQTISIN